MKRMLFSTVVFIFMLSFEACNLPDTDNRPQKDWTIERIVYYKNASPPRYYVYWGGEDAFNECGYYYEKDKRTGIDFTDIVVIPGVTCTGWATNLHNGFGAFAANGGTPTGDAVITYSDKYFYELTGGDGYFDAEWTAEVRIVTKTVPVTVIP